ncbi:unnamed protein product [Psylliodes chrysocephalus]|uniref:Peptidase S1 domain-containing protein n=1 Tax=Psylliodes chrysocephalus TaxID=3402493 RepID=A0A9P0CV75_9CUCU|nr:unnamed protein product [Psylliodes chrysocephala]
MLNDIALMKLDSPMKVSEKNNFVKLPARSHYYGLKNEGLSLEKDDISQFCPEATIVGWGTTSKNNYYIVPTKLMCVELPIIPIPVCRFILRMAPAKVTLENVCAGGYKNKDSCVGDSGGPLLCDNYQLGITSWGPDCAVGLPSVYTRFRSLRRVNNMQCKKCNKLFSNAYTLKRHQLKNCVDRKPACPIPKKRLRPIGIEVLEGGVTKLTHAFKNRIASYRFSSSDENKISYNDFFNGVKPKVINKISEYLQQHISLKINMEIFGIYVKPDKEMSDIKSMNSPNKIVTTASNLEELYGEFKSELMMQASEFQEKDSNWSLQEIMFLDVNINRFNSIAASSYIKLPVTIMKRNAVLNIENKDSACFAWSINAAIFPAEGNPKYPSSYPHYDKMLDFRGIDFPVKLKDIKKFEFMNNISVNVFGLESFFRDGKNNYEVVGPLHFTSNRQPTHVNLLLVSDSDGNNHYNLITDLPRLVRSQKTKYKGKIYICDGCLQSYVNMEKLKAHEEHDCTHIYTQLPTNEMKKNKCGQITPENILKFINFEKQLQVPFVIYADFESLLKPIDNCEPINGKSFSVKVCEHEPYSFAFYLKCSYDDSLSKLEIYKGPNAGKVFMQKLDETVHNLYNNHLKHVKVMQKLTPKEQEAYDNATNCYICEKPFDVFNKKVRDHCHLLGKYRNAAHNSCNLNYKVPNCIPVFFHNLSNYDCHLFIKELSTKGESVSAIAQTKEKYISFSKSILVEKSDDPKVRDSFIKLRFVDSFRFLARSLDKLSETLDSLDEVRKYFPNETQFNLMRRIRGGVAQCSKRQAMANNKFLPNYNPSKPESYIMYLDATNLYGAAMSESLPFGGFKWIPVENFDCNSVKDDASKGYVLEVDLEYPTNLHDAHNDLPFCPESIIPLNGKHPKLIPNLRHKEKYIIHYRNLKQCLKYGLKLTKIHRILEYSQSPWLKKYIESNTTLRNQAKNDFEKDLFKLLVNAIFGKTMENVEKRKSIHLSTHWKIQRVHLGNVKVYYDKPMYIGFSVLDISKTIIYEFLYGYIKPKYGNAAKLCYTDTDSLILEVFTSNFYDDMKQNITHFDTSNFSKNNEYGMPITNSIVGKMKDEFAGTIVDAFYGTGAKAYCVKLGKPFKKETEIKKAKGVSKNIIKNQLHVNDYIRIIQNGNTIFRKMYIFVSSLHTIYTELRNKVALSAKDDKRYVIPHDVNTLAWGHLLTNPKAMTGTLDDLIQAMEEVSDLDNYVNDFDLELFSQ